ncbi:phospholipase [Brevundimonas naejangsanensis]|uniref:Phospholipase n=1 Tax=Brevundimonas naejangsanensis TaxID=588932 RepID=A0A494RHY7_9CAUL|nr:patatin-like phospholipase family protein [Brevundimonas naejangsanensis]AYG95039.1 phospholipase [Brevundimonas naejangsanensis]
MRLLRLLALILLPTAALALGACQTMPRPAFQAADLAAASPPWRYDFLSQEARDRFVRETLDASQATTDGTFDILALSGGGANGAYGAGVMVGWSQAGDRPDFEVVTGVSTGALIAPFVFAGPAFDPDLRHAYTSGQTDRLLRSRGLFALIFPGVFKPEPLTNLVVDNVTPELLDAIAAEHRKGRRLYVSTTSLDAQTQVVWDMGAIAQRTDPASRLLFVNVLIASASIPGAFPPVLLDVAHQGRRVQELHVDGSTVSSFLVVPQALFLGSGPISRPLDDARIWIVVNGKSEPRFEVARISAVGIAARSFDTMVKALQRSDLIAVTQFARRYGVTLSVAAIPDETPANTLDFTQAHMTALFQAGEAQARAGRAFETQVAPVQPRPPRFTPTPSDPES